MPVHVRWYIPGRIVLHEFSGDVRLEDAAQSSLEGPALAEQGTPPVHMLVSLVGITRYPRSIHQLEAAIHIYPKADQLGRVVILVRHNPLLRFIATILTQIHYSRLRFVIVEDEAEALRSFLAHDASLAEVITPDGRLISSQTGA